MTSLVEHARRELALAGNDEAFNDSIIRAVQAFSSYGHSGGSASVAIPMLNELLCHRNITPLTDDPKEWIQHSEAVWGEPGGIWQNSRNSSAFSRDRGKTYFLNENPELLIETTKT